MSAYEEKAPTAREAFETVRQELGSRHLASMVHNPRRAT